MTHSGRLSREKWSENRQLADLHKKPRWMAEDKSMASGIINLASGIWALRSING